MPGKHFSGKISQIMRFLVFWGLVTNALMGCTLLAQVDSITGTKTDQLRDIVRDDVDRHRLIVFVHGFNSSKKRGLGRIPKSCPRR